MDENERAQFARMVERARLDKGWSAARLSEEAGVSENTLTKVKRGQSVAPGTLAKLREALGIEPRSTYTPGGSAEYDREVDFAREVLGQWLQAMPYEERVEAARYLIRCIMSHEHEQQP